MNYSKMDVTKIFATLRPRTDSIQHITKTLQDAECATKGSEWERVRLEQGEVQGEGLLKEPVMWVSLVRQETDEECRTRVDSMKKYMEDVFQQTNNEFSYMILNLPIGEK